MGLHDTLKHKEMCPNSTVLEGCVIYKCIYYVQEMSTSLCIHIIEVLMCTFVVISQLLGFPVVIEFTCMDF